jgi:hypothetical protein
MLQRKAISLHLFIMLLRTDEQINTIEDTIGV